MPLQEAKKCLWLAPVIKSKTSDLERTFPKDIQEWLTMANTRARLRMVTLYAFAGSKKMLVAGTGNKVEDFRSGTDFPQGYTGMVDHGQYQGAFTHGYPLCLCRKQKNACGWHR